MSSKLQNREHTVDFCIIGGGLSGVCAAISAARAGIKVALVQDRSVLGGNASSEIRMWICGAKGDNNRETGIIEEILLENLYRNPERNYSIWDGILYEKVILHKNISLFLNTSCIDATLKDNTIKSVKCYQNTTQTWITIKSTLFADCSGDSILAPLTKAMFRVGREGQDEFNESIAPKVADDKTMGLSCLIQVRESDSPKKFIPPKFAYKYDSEEKMPKRTHTLNKQTNFWWIEIGGDKDTIADSEEIKDELIKIAYGVWDHIKNYGDHGADNWVLDWISMVAGRRESR